MTNTKVTATAHTNIALIKYWGKADATLNLPTTSSLSMTLDRYATRTSVTFSPEFDGDCLFLDSKEVDSGRVQRFLDFIRQREGDFPSLRIDSENEVPTAAGLASSASGFAALTAAVYGLLEISATPEELSRVARRGSGSAARSIFGNFALWHKGEDDVSSYAESFYDADIGLSMLVAEVSSEEKKMSSTQGMQLAQTSPDYSRWVSDSAVQLKEMQAAILAKDIEKIGLIAQVNALTMHALNRTSRQPFDYFTEETRRLLDFVESCYRQGLLAFATIDAGPNVKIITDRATEWELLKRAQSDFPEIHFELAHAGEGVQLG